MCTIELKEDSLIAGGVLGGITAYYMSKKSVEEVIMRVMTDAQREKLAASVAVVIAKLPVKDPASLLPFLQNNQHAKEAVLQVVFAFIEEEMKLHIVD